VAGTYPTTNSCDGIDKWPEPIQPPIGSMALKSGRNQSSHLIEIPSFKKHTISTSIVKKVAGSHPVTYCATTCYIKKQKEDNKNRGRVDVLYPHYQVGGVWTENSLPTMEYQVVGKIVQNVETLEAALQDVHGCAKMPADLKKFWK
jgi:hypothetical protein